MYNKLDSHPKYITAYNKRISELTKEENSQLVCIYLGVYNYIKQVELQVFIMVVVY